MARSSPQFGLKAFLALAIFALGALVGFVVRPMLRDSTLSAKAQDTPATAPSPLPGPADNTLAEKDLTIADLKTDLEATRRLVAEQREIIRKHSLSTASPSIDEMLAFFPTKFPGGNWQPAESLSMDSWFQASDGIRLHGWYFPQDHPAAAILVIHGNAGNLTHRSYLAQLLHDRYKAAVMLFDYRGYGRSEGTPTVSGVLRDARAARHHLAKVEGIDDGTVVLLGESLGGAVAVDLAAEDGARALILESTFSSLRDVAGAHYSRLLTDVLVADRLDSVVKIKKYHGPLLQSHGDRDQTIPFELARKLFDAANEPKQFVLLPGKDHNDAKTEEYYKALGAFLARLKAQPAN